MDPIFPPPIHWPNTKKHMAPDNVLENNKFELIFDEIVDGPPLKLLYHNSNNCKLILINLKWKWVKLKK